MKRTGRILCLTVFLLILLTGCKEGSAASASPEQTVSASPGNQMKIITIYSIEPDTLELVPVYVKKENKKKSPEYIVALVKNNLSAYDIKIPALKKKGKNLYVSFSAEGEPVKNCNKKVEKLILECFANSLLDNIKSCENIILQIDGNAYESDNFKFGKEEVYASR